MTWVYLVPEWALFIAIVAAMALLTSFGLTLYRRTVPQSDDVSHNDVAGPIISTVGTLLAVILSFMLVSVWQEYDAAAATVVQESSAITDLYHSASNFPEPTRSQIRSDIRDYVNTLITQEWPAMRDGKISPTATEQSLRMLTTLIRFQPANSAMQELQQNAIGFVDTSLDARRDRIFANAEGIPLIFWAGILVLTAITIVCSFIFRIRNQHMHLFMCIALAIVIGVTFVLIAEFDYPFRGQGQIAPTPWLALQSVINDTPSPLPELQAVPTPLRSP